MYLRNAWYVAAWDHELSREPMARVLLDEPVVMFRTEDGRPVALEDRCCHRRAPLSLGWIKGDHIQCGYHGLKFDRTGACVEVPGQSLVPPGARIHSYPVVERHRWIWIWMGDPEQADDSQIPDMYWHDSPEWVGVGELYHVKCNYQNLIDIQLDNTHSAYVHPTSLGNTGTVTTQPKVRRDDGAVYGERLMPGSNTPPIWAKAGNLPDKTDNWVTWIYRPPSTCTFDAGAALMGTGALEGDRSHGVTIYVSHGNTPETATSTHYFWLCSRNFALDDEEVHRAVGGIRDTFREDVVMCEAQQRIIAMAPDAPTIDVNADNPTIQARNLLARMIEAEQGQTAGTARRISGTG